MVERCRVYSLILSNRTKYLFFPAHVAGSKQQVAFIAMLRPCRKAHTAILHQQDKGN